jgi:hypothetical protein
VPCRRSIHPSFGGDARGRTRMPKGAAGHFRDEIEF